MAGILASLVFTGGLFALSELHSPPLMIIGAVVLLVVCLRVALRGGK
jgi:hypothetical protein